MSKGVLHEQRDQWGGSDKSNVLAAFSAASMSFAEIVLSVGDKGTKSIAIATERISKASRAQGTSGKPTCRKVEDHSDNGEERLGKEHVGLRRGF